MTTGRRVHERYDRRLVVRVKFEDVNEPRNRKWLYPYVRVNILDQSRKMIGTEPLIYSITTTDTETSADYNWIMFKKEFSPPQGAASFYLVMYMYEKEGVSGTVYLDDIRIVQKFKD